MEHLNESICKECDPNRIQNNNSNISVEHGTVFKRSSIGIPCLSIKVYTKTNYVFPEFFFYKIASETEGSFHGGSSKIG